jgi:hypothetical protein
MTTFLNVESVMKQQSQLGSAKTTKKSPIRYWVIAGGFGLSAVVVSAFAHLLIVSLQSQPDCVPHSKAGEVAPLNHTAAKSSC